MTDAELEAIEARAKTATPGELGYDVQPTDVGEHVLRADGATIASFERLEDAVLFERARSDVPALVAEVRRLRLQVAAEREACAKVAEKHAEESQQRLREGRGREMDCANAGAGVAADEIASAIRARQTEGK